MKTAIYTKVFAGRTLEKAFELAAELGYDAVELMCREPHLGRTTTPERARHLKERLDNEGVAVAGLGTYTGGYGGQGDGFERELDALETFLELADVFETDLLRHNAGGPFPTAADSEEYERVADWLRRAADLVGEYDKRLALELHHGGLTETVESTLRLIELVDRENLGVIHDAGNMYIADEEYGPASIERLGDRLFHVHVKDELRVDDPSLPGAFEAENRTGSGVFQHRRLGHGDVDHGPVFEALERIGYDGYVSVECHAPEDRIWTDTTIAAHELEMVEGYRRRATN